MKTIKTLKRFFVLALLLCLGITQGWAASETKTITLNAKPAENGVISWTSEDGMVTFTLTPVPEYQEENNRFELSPRTTYQLSWVHSYDLNKYDFKVSRFSARNCVSRRDNITYTAGITFTCECTNASASNNLITLVGGNYEKWETTNLNISSSTHDEDTYISITTGAAEAGAGLLDRSKFNYYLEWMTITYTVTEREFSAKINVVKNISAGGTATVNGKASDTKGDIISDALVAAGSKQYDFTLSAEPNEGYDFLGWSETQNEEDIVCEDTEMPYSITCDLSNIAIEKTWYAIFVKRFDKVAMDVKMVQVLRPVDTWTKATDIPAQGSDFLIASSNSNRALANSTSNSVSLSLTEGYYDGEVNGNNQPYTYSIDNAGHIKCFNGQYLNASYSNGILGIGRGASISLGNNASTVWNVVKTDGGFQVSCPLNNTTYYLISPSGNGAFRIQTGAGDLNFYTPTTREKYVPEQADPFTFKIVANAAQGTEVNYATLYCEDAYEMPAGVTGYFIKDAVEAGELTYKERYSGGDIVPARTALLLTGAPGEYSTTRYDAKVGGEKTAREYTDAVDNQLEGRRENGYTASARENVYYYKLTWKDKDNHGLGVYFYWGAPDGGAFALTNLYTAYLAVSKENQAHSFRLPGFEDEDNDEVNSIDAVENNISNGAIYTISGVRVNDTTNLPAGIYIRNGKKFIVR